MKRRFDALEQRFVTIEQRFAAIEQFINTSRDQRAVYERWQGGVDKMLELHERQIHGFSAFNQREAS